MPPSESGVYSGRRNARQVGMGTPANLRTRFRRATKVSPREHRRLFAFGQSG